MLWVPEGVDTLGAAVAWLIRLLLLLLLLVPCCAWMHFLLAGTEQQHGCQSLLIFLPRSGWNSHTHCSRMSTQNISHMLPRLMGLTNMSALFLLPPRLHELSISL
jgi:hypothetical protein